MLWHVLNPGCIYSLCPFSSTAEGFFLLLCMIILLASCTDYEREGINPRPFNEPVEWETNPYGDAFRN